MKSSKNLKRKLFWKEVLMLGIPFLFVFFIIRLLLNSSDDIFSGNFSEVAHNNFRGIHGLLFLSSVVIPSFIGSLVIVSYNREERAKELEEEQMI